MNRVLKTTSLETPRLIIRDVDVDDAAALHAWMQREAYWRYVPIEVPTMASIARMMEVRITAQAKVPRAAYAMAVTSRGTGAVIGEALLFVRHLRWRQGEIGWGVSADHLGQGLATEIGAALLEFAFLGLGLHRVFAQCHPDNAASRRVMVKLGMREEGTLRENVLARGAWWSSVQYGILTPEWQVERARTDLM